MEVGEEVVDGLSEDPGPVYAVDGSETVLCVEFAIAEEDFDDVLAIIECAFDSYVVHVGIGDGSHLRFLDWGYATFWVEDED